MIRRPPRSTLSSSSAASDVYKRQVSTQSTGTLSRNMPLARLPRRSSELYPEHKPAALTPSPPLDPIPGIQEVRTRGRSSSDGDIPDRSKPRLKRRPRPSAIRTNSDPTVLQPLDPQNKRHWSACLDQWRQKEAQTRQPLLRPSSAQPRPHTTSTKPLAKLKQILGQKPGIGELDRMRLVPEIPATVSDLTDCEEGFAKSRTRGGPSSNRSNGDQTKGDTVSGGTEQAPDHEVGAGDKPEHTRVSPEILPEAPELVGFRELTPIPWEVCEPPKQLSPHSPAPAARKTEYPAASRAVLLAGISMSLLQDGVAPKLVDRHEGDEEALRRLSQGGDQAYELMMSPTGAAESDSNWSKTEQLMGLRPVLKATEGGGWEHAVRTPNPAASIPSGLKRLQLPGAARPSHGVVPGMGGYDELRKLRPQTSPTPLRIRTS
eukprot:TRINITY_DN1641_c0_g1_i7.p1 TRINITY_DN1641_c0_g1~~TRINITY_DN1641_c0_g1_i7.p1  ORF type:complete len:432 (-),score=74.73 TRINITY_DN1641_c0_g1_i7:167-1462(-)